jgi:hypothetical protein
MSVELGQEDVLRNLVGQVLPGARLLVNLPERQPVPSRLDQLLGIEVRADRVAGELER